MPNLTRKAVEQQLSDYQVPEPVCATVRALLTKVEQLQQNIALGVSRLEAELDTPEDIWASHIREAIRLLQEQS